ncbi:NAD(P)-dependent oxidoreductase [Burkholderia plantarii]|uniref:NAD(P)-dependent oxidoreductase n=1 Tax=Burkholderia plantarii TaxID=41899 RepID=UPI0018DDA766|nr:DUF1932 domain-containing protein [Burkholderia plantarii]MBI0331808.1 NAD(P)-dependent oxidoreductase [Burkholderia plantarii]
MNHAAPSPQPVAIVGFGEVGPILARAFTDQGLAVAAYDIKLEHPDTRESILRRARASGAQAAGSLAAALDGAQLVFSAVTASQAGAVAAACAPLLGVDQVFIDLNSVSPAVKQRNAEWVEGGRAAYVEAAVMAPVPPHGIRAPMLLGGARAAELAGRLNGLGMRTEAVADAVGLASAIKLCRSIMIKGMEALCVQSMLAANAFGIDARVLASLAASFPGTGWDSGYEAYLIGRVVEHGQRRSEEMDEAAAMLDSLGMSGALAREVAAVQREQAARAPALRAALDERGALPGWRDLLRRE